MTTQQHPLKVFLCHASTDKSKVRELYRYLRRRGIKPWLAEIDLMGGQDWQVEITKALATSDAIVICLTKNSVDKEGYIQKEIKFALDRVLEMPEGRIFLIPVRFEECEVPFLLRRYQWVDLFTQEDYQKLIRSLHSRSQENRIPSATQPPNQTKETRPEPKKPPVPFSIRLIFTLVGLTILVYITQTYFNNQNLFTCTPPTISATGVSITLWLLVSLGWCYLGEPVTNLIDTVPPGQQDFKVLLTKIIVRLTDLFLLGQLPKKILLLFTTASVVSTLIIWELNRNGIPMFNLSSEETPQIVGFSVINTDVTQIFRPGDTIELARGQQFSVTANHVPDNVVCKWSSGSRGILPMGQECVAQYGVPLTVGEVDTLTVQVQSACKTKSVFASLNVKILEP